jgi:hypothetical protein
MSELARRHELTTAIVWFVSGGSVAQQSVRQLELIPPRAGRCHGDLDPSHADSDQSAQLHSAGLL